MSDQPDYRHQVLTEIVAAIGTGPELTMDVIGNRLGDLYAQHQQADDQTAMAIISEAWGNVQMLASATDNAINIAAAAKEVAVTMMFQRDEALTAIDDIVKERDSVQEAYDDLERAVETYDYDHPVVSGLIEAVQEDAYSDLMNDGGYHTADPAMDITEVAMIDVTHHQASIFFECLIGQRLDGDSMFDALRTELEQFIREFTAKVSAAESAYLEAQRQKWVSKE